MTTFIHSTKTCNFETKNLLNLPYQQMETSSHHGTLTWSHPTLAVNQGRRHVGGRVG